MPRVSEAHLAARRQQILDAAAVCIRRNGVHTTSMQDVIKEAGLSVGAVYRYFKSKHEIIAALAGQNIGQLTQALSDVGATDPPLPLADAMERVLEIYEPALGPDGMFRVAVQMWGEALRDEAIAELVRERIGGVREAFVTIARGAREIGDLPPESDPEQVGAVLFAMVPGYALQRMLAGTPDRAAFVAGLRALVA